VKLPEIFRDKISLLLYCII